MRFLILFMGLGVFAQSLPTLPAVNVFSNAELACSFESQDDQGGLFVQCKNPATAEVLYTSVVEAAPNGTVGSIVGYGSIMCLYWTDDNKHRLQCGDGKKILADGYLPPVTRKRRWYLFWR